MVDWGIRGKVRVAVIVKVFVVKENGHFGKLTVRKRVTEEVGLLLRESLVEEKEHPTQLEMALPDEGHEEDQEISVSAPLIRLPARNLAAFSVALPSITVLYCVVSSAFNGGVVPTFVGAVGLGSRHTTMGTHLFRLSLAISIFPRQLLALARRNVLLAAGAPRMRMELLGASAMAEAFSLLLVSVLSANYAPFLATFVTLAVTEIILDLHLTDSKTEPDLWRRRLGLGFVLFCSLAVTYRQACIDHLTVLCYIGYTSLTYWDLNDVIFEA